MMDRGFRAVRVRCHENLARIEVAKNDRIKLFDVNILEEISSKLKEFGLQICNFGFRGL